MLFADGAGAFIFFALWVFCVVDVIVTDESRCRNLAKVVWLLIVLLLPALGSIAWLVAGHPWGSARAVTSRASLSRPSGSRPSGRRATQFPEYDRPGRAVASDPAADEAFLAAVRAKAEAQREEYRRRRAAELEAERRRLTEPPPTA